MLRVMILAAAFLLAPPVTATDLVVRLFALTPPAALKVRTPGGAWRTLADSKINRIELPAGSEMETDFGLIELPGKTSITASEGKLKILLSIPLEEYVAAVIAGEVKGLPLEARKASAVAARTFAWGNRKRHNGYDLCDTTHCQDLRLSGRWEGAREAAESTRGEMLWYRGKPAEVYYHRHCGGLTERGTELWPELEAPYLESVTDRYCLRPWVREIAVGEVLRALGIPHLLTPEVTLSGRTAGGRNREWRLGPPVNRTLPAPEVRMALGRAYGWDRLPSDRYTLVQEGPLLKLKGSGSGHGVGLCQSGAAALAKNGASYRAILKHYFPGTEVSFKAAGFQWQSISGERYDLFTTTPDQAAPYLTQVEEALRAAETRSGWRFTKRPKLRAYATVAQYRDATGEPGWVAASAGGGEIRLQPLDLLAKRTLLRPTLMHEGLHLLIEERAHHSLPLWFREGLALHLANPGGPPADRTADLAQLDQSIGRPTSEAQMQQAYHQVRGLVADLERRHGLASILRWVSAGLPAEVAAYSKR